MLVTGEDTVEGAVVVRDVAVEIPLLLDGVVNEKVIIVLLWMVVELILVPLDEESVVVGGEGDILLVETLVETLLAEPLVKLILLLIVLVDEYEEDSALELEETLVEEMDVPELDDFKVAVTLVELVEIVVVEPELREVDPDDVEIVDSEFEDVELKENEEDDIVG